MSAVLSIRQVGPHTVVRARSAVTGYIQEMTMPIDFYQFQSCYEAWEAGAYIQSAFEELDDNQREFLLTGMTPADWESIFGLEED